MNLTHKLPLVALLLFSSLMQAQQYSLAINNGRGIDPESGLDAIRHVGVSGDIIVAISATPLAR